MFKRVAIILAGAVFSSGIALAADVDGTYSCTRDGQQYAVTLTSDGGVVRGQAVAAGVNYTLAGRESDGMIQGVLCDQNGQQIPFAAAEGQSGLQLQAGGVVYDLAKAATKSKPARDETNPLSAVPVNAATTQNVADLPQLETHRGQSLQCDIPAGWSFSSTNNGVDSTAPDGITWMSRVFVRAMGQTTPDIMMRRSSQGWARLGMSDVQVVSAKDLSDSSKLYELTYDFRGHPAQAMVQATVHARPGGYVSDMIMLQGSPDTFKQNLPVMIAMAKSVRVIDANAFADTGKSNQLAKQRNQIAAQSAQDIGNIIVNGQAARSAVDDQTFKGADDTLRSQTRFQDPGGQEYTGPLQATRAFKHADGTVTYTSDVSAPVPSDATELNPYDYSGR